LPETLFISDLHLSPDRPGTVNLFLRFLATRAHRTPHLYILGDLFDAWIGDDDDSPPSPAVCAALRDLTQAGTACWVMHGNRDFLLGRRFARDTGCTLLKDPTLINLGGTPTLLMHGDLLCTDDVAYQRFRLRMRNPLIQQLFLWKSIAGRRAIAAEYRRKSGAATATKTETIMDVNADTVAAYLNRYGATTLVHGHTHRPADHRLDLPALVWSGGVWRREAITP
jgi:UDP-2,3-diacylglucosamine hydrolase